MVVGVFIGFLVCVSTSIDRYLFRVETAIPILLLYMTRMTRLLYESHVIPAGYRVGYDATILLTNKGLKAGTKAQVSPGYQHMRGFIALGADYIYLHGHYKESEYMASFRREIQSADCLI